MDGNAGTQNEMGKNKDTLRVRGNKPADKKQPDYGCVPSRFWYSFFGSGIVINLCRLVFGMKIRTDKTIKNMPGPLVIVGNHPSYIDPIIMGTTVYGRPINFVAGNFLFRNRIFGHIITKGGCIPKAQYKNDMRTVRAMMKVLTRGGVLGIFPEATRMVAGHSVHFDNALANLVKKTGAGLCFLRTHGAYMTWPRWSANSWRRGRITTEYVGVITKEEIAQMSVEEIHKKMLEYMDYDEYAYFREHPQVFRSKAPAAGVQNVANICPRCEKFNSTEVEKDGHTVVCRSCGNRVVMDKYGFFSPSGSEDKYFPDLRSWELWEKTVYEKEAARPDYCLNEKVELYQPLGEYGHAKIGYGMVTIRDGVVTYRGTASCPEDGIEYKKGKPVRAHREREAAFEARKEHIAELVSSGETDISIIEKTFPVKNMKGVLYDFGLYFELYESGGQVNRFVPENRQRIYEIYCIIRAMKDMGKDETP